MRYAWVGQQPRPLSECEIFNSTNMPQLNSDHSIASLHDETPHVSILQSAPHHPTTADILRLKIRHASVSVESGQLNLLIFERYKDSTLRYTAARTTIASSSALLASCWALILSPVGAFTVGRIQEVSANLYSYSFREVSTVLWG